MMEYFNIFGTVFIAVLMIPNIIYAAKCKNEFVNIWKNKTVEILEQIGRYGCFGTMIINIPGTWFGFPSDETFALYLIINTVLITAYCIIWVICFKKNTLFRAVTLSVLPSLVFLFSGIISRYVLLTISAVIFAPCHILISCKNVQTLWTKHK